jgi:hypothetical protein
MKLKFKTQAYQSASVQAVVEMDNVRIGHRSRPTATSRQRGHVRAEQVEMETAPARPTGWSKFIIVVPSIAIREGVAKSLEITAEHFWRPTSKKARFFIYNSKQLHHLESFSSDAGINVMVINVQAFAARGADNRRIYEELDDFQSRRPIDVISANRPILILDEPQKMEVSAKTLEVTGRVQGWHDPALLRHPQDRRTTRSTAWMHWMPTTRSW